MVRYCNCFAVEESIGKFGPSIGLGNASTAVQEANEHNKEVLEAQLQVSRFMWRLLPIISFASSVRKSDRSVTESCTASPAIRPTMEKSTNQRKGEGINMGMQAVLSIVLLIISNVFMTFAWYGHLHFRAAPLWQVILISWLIAFLEYCFQVPANRIGSYEFSAAQLKIIQEVITLVVFGVFSVLYLKQQFQWNYLVAFVFLVGAVFFVFVGGNTSSTEQAHSHSEYSKVRVMAKY